MSDFQSDRPARPPRPDLVAPQEIPLRVWLDENGKTPYWIAKNLCVFPRIVGRWMAGQCIPDLVSAYKIERLTRGEIPVSSWLSTPLGKHLWEHGVADWDRFMALNRARVKKSWRKHRDRKLQEMVDARQK